MNSTKNSIEEQQSNVGRIYTKLKFTKSEQSGCLVSFVSKNPKNGMVRGVRQDSTYPKKICVVDKFLSNEILLNVLYDCTLIPMTEKNGYIVIAAEPVQFKAHIETTHVKNTIYLVEVKFGNKVFIFDPFNGRKDSIKSLPACKAVLEKRVDVQDLIQVVEDFEKAANNILSLMEMERYNKGKRIK